MVNETKTLTSERLRAYTGYLERLCGEKSSYSDLLLLAADELDRLRQENKRLREVVRLAVDEIERYTGCHTCTNQSCYKRHGKDNCKWQWRHADKLKGLVENE